MRTSSVEQAEAHVRAVAAHHVRAFGVCGSVAARRRGFETHIRKQRLADELCARILSCAGPDVRPKRGRARFRTDVVVAFGDAGFSHASAGQAAGPNKWLKRHLARFCAVVDTDEFRTSKLCSRCHGELSGKAPPGFWSDSPSRRRRKGREGLFFGGEPEFGTDGGGVPALDWGLRRCGNSECDSHWWNRDVNAARNIGLVRVFFSKQLGCGVPDGFRRDVGRTVGDDPPGGIPPSEGCGGGGGDGRPPESKKSKRGRWPPSTSTK